MLSISMIGNLGKDAEIILKENKKILVFNLAEHNNDKPQWVECSMKISDESKLPEYLKKGDRIFVSGYPYVKSWKSKDGEPMATLAVYVDKIELLSQKQ